MGTARRSSKSSAAAGSGSRMLWHGKAWAGVLLLAALGLGGHWTWRSFAPAVAQHPQFQITAERIHITPPPPWIRADIKAEVLRGAGLAGTLSVLDSGEALQQRIRDAFGFHPWVAAVRQIKFGLPASLEVELEYRRPVAAVEAVDGQNVSYLPIDAWGTRLPDADFSDVERRYLPRISGVTGRPVVGALWSDERVIHAAALAAKLADVWNELRLVAIIPSPHLLVRGDARFYTFEITTSGGTRIVWGAAPGEEQHAAESPFDAKRQRLLEYAAEKGQLDSIDGPASVDVRTELVVVPRTARRKVTKPDDEPTTTK